MLVALRLFAQVVCVSGLSGAYWHSRQATSSAAGLGVLLTQTSPGGGRPSMFGLPPQLRIVSIVSDEMFESQTLTLLKM